MIVLLSEKNGNMCLMRISRTKFNLVFLGDQRDNENLDQASQQHNI